MAPGGVAERIEARLALLLGPNNARNAVRTFARRSLEIEPEQLRPGDAARLMEALRPMLRTLLGATTAERVIREITEDVG
ncbi:MAG: hypothetical protein QM767_07875 [Anaeromyxobacter sp.]